MLLMALKETVHLRSHTFPFKYVKMYYLGFNICNSSSGDKIACRDSGGSPSVPTAAAEAVPVVVNKSLV